jgi:Major intrinsic protein
MIHALTRRFVSEFFGTSFLVAAVVGAGIIAEHLANGNAALALLANTIATGAALVALILAFGPISGARMNPVVSFMDALEGGLRWKEVPHYVIAQIIGGIAGTVTHRCRHTLVRPPIRGGCNSFVHRKVEDRFLDGSYLHAHISLLSSNTPPRLPSLYYYILSMIYSITNIGVASGWMKP